jgi:hypothetical protein
MIEEVVYYQPFSSYVSHPNFATDSDQITYPGSTQIETRIVHAGTACEMPRGWADRKGSAAASVPISVYDT